MDMTGTEFDSAPGTGFSQARLKREMLNLSASQVWDTARTEWELSTVLEGWQDCLCGHYPIKELCLLVNTETGSFATVGNCCVRRFVQLPSNLVFQAIKRVRRDITRSLNTAAVSLAHRNQWINDWELKFYQNVMRRRDLSHKQRAKKAQINRAVLAAVSRNSAPPPRRNAAAQLDDPRGILQ